MEYCYKCHKHVNLKEIIHYLIDMTMTEYNCEECGTWIKTLTLPTKGDKYE